MPRGVKITEIVTGGGEIAKRGNTVVVNVRFFLSRGEELNMRPGPRLVIDLFKRECIAGLRQGIEGMCAGGRRSLRISPHLAYGEAGLPGLIPPNAVLMCDVELLEVREPGMRTREDHPPGLHLFVFRQSVPALALPCWQFGLHDDGRCGLGVTVFAGGMSLRFARRGTAARQLDPESTEGLFQAALAIPTQWPEQCLRPEEELGHCERIAAVVRFDPAMRM